MTTYVNIKVDSNSVNLINEAHKELYKAAIETCRYNQTKAAKVLGVSRGTLRYTLDKYYPGQYVNFKG